MKNTSKKQQFIYFLIVIIGLFFFQNTQAQTITGKVTDKKGEAVMFGTVALYSYSEDTSILLGETITDINGKYQITSDNPVNSEFCVMSVFYSGIRETRIIFRSSQSRLDIVVRDEMFSFCVYPFTYLFYYSSNKKEWIKGIILDDRDGTPLANSHVFLEKLNVLEADAVYSNTTTNENGFFALSVESKGVYELSISKDYSYSERSLIVKEKKGKYKSLGIRVYVGGRDGTCVFADHLDEETIRRKREKKFKEKTKEQPSNFNDASRTLSVESGIRPINDQAYQFSIRGNAPMNNKWYLDDIEIPTPVHFPISKNLAHNFDGSIGLLQANGLSNIELYKNFLPTHFSNALGGVFAADIINNYGLNEGNAVDLTTNGVGLDLTTSHSNIGRTTFKGRYNDPSWLGDALGGDWENKKARFQDYSLVSTWQLKELGRLKFFSTYGTSQYHSEGQKDSTIWAMDSDQQNLDFHSTTSISGVSYKINDKSHSFSSTFLYATQHKKQSATFVKELTKLPFQQDSSAHERLAFKLKYVQKNKFKIQFNGAYLTDKLHNFDAITNQQTIGTQAVWLLQPSMSYQTVFNTKKVLNEYGDPQKVYLNIGIRGNYFSTNQTYSIEPTIRISNKFSYILKWNWALSYSLQSQLQTPDIYLSQNEQGDYLNRDLDFSKAHHFNFQLGANYKEMRFSIDLYRQQLFNIPIIDKENAHFSVINQDYTFIIDPLTNTGSGLQQGIELNSGHHFIFKNYRNREKGRFSTHLNTTFYQSKYTAGDGVQRNTRFNGGHITQLVIGPKWNFITYNYFFDGSSLNKLGFHFKIIYGGGLKETPIDLLTSQQLGRTIYELNNPYSLSQNDFFRIDANIYWTIQFVDKSRYKKLTSTLSFNIQNLTNQENLAFQYFDTVQNDVVPIYQLGMMPYLSWRIEF